MWQNVYITSSRVSRVRQGLQDKKGNVASSSHMCRSNRGIREITAI